MSKSIFSLVNLDDLPSRRGPKKQKSGKTSLPKVPKFTPTINLDDPMVNVVQIGRASCRERVLMSV